MKTKSIITIVAGLLVSAGFAFAETTNTGRCGQERGTCGNECDGSGFMNQGRGQGNGSGQGFRRGQRDGNGEGRGLRRGNRDGSGRGDQQRQRRRDGSGPGCN